MPAPVLQFKRGNAGVAGTVPALRPGEPAISLNNFDFFIGIDTSVANNKFFGSHRYWGREDGTNSLKLNLVDKDGTNAISIKSPDTLVGTGTYILPDTSTITDGYYLKVAADGTLSWSDAGTSGGSFSNASFTGITTVTGSLDATGAGVNAGIVTVTDLYIDSTRVLYDDGSGITLAGIQTIDATTKSTLETILSLDPNDFNSLNVVGIATIGGLLDANDGADIFGQTELDSLNVSVAATFASATVSDLTSGRVVLAGVSGKLEDSSNLTFDGTSLTVGTGVGITQFSGSVSTGTSTSSVPTSSAVIDYVENYVGGEIGSIDLTLDIDADTGGPSSVTTGQTLTIAGTANEIRTSVSGQTITVGLNTNVTVSNDLTVQGNLYVNGSTTQVNTTSLTVEDRTIDLGIVNGAAPTSATTWDLGVLFNYFDTAAQKSGVIWEHSATRFQFASTLTSESGSTDANNPQIVTATFAPIEIGALWVTDCAGTSQVISCTGTERFLENITVDAGTF